MEITDKKIEPNKNRDVKIMAVCVVAMLICVVVRSYVRSEMRKSESEFISFGDRMQSHYDEISQDETDAAATNPMWMQLHAPGEDSGNDYMKIAPVGWDGTVWRWLQVDKNSDPVSGRLPCRTTTKNE